MTIKDYLYLIFVVFGIAISGFITSFLDSRQEKADILKIQEEPITVLELYNGHRIDKCGNEWKEKTKSHMTEDQLKEFRELRDKMDLKICGYDWNVYEDVWCEDGECYCEYWVRTKVGDIIPQLLKGK